VTDPPDFVFPSDLAGRPPSWRQVLLTLPTFRGEDGFAGRSALKWAWFAFDHMALYAGEPPPSWYASNADSNAEYDADHLQGTARLLQWQLALATLKRIRKHNQTSLADPDDNALAQALSDALAIHIPRLRTAVGMDAAPPQTEDEARATDPRSGILLWDDRLARYLDELDTEGQTLAAITRDEAPDPRQLDWQGTDRPGDLLWARWAKTGKALDAPKSLERLAWALWFDVVAPELRDKARRLPAGLARQQALTLVRRYSPEALPEIDADDIGAIPSALVPHALKAVRSKLGFRIVGQALRASAAQAMRGSPNAGRFVFMHGENHVVGWLQSGGGALPQDLDPADLPKLRGKAKTSARDAIAGLFVRTEMEGGGWLAPFSGSYLPGKGGAQGHRGRRPAAITLTLDSSLLPGFAKYLAEAGGTRARENKRVTPWIEAPLEGLGVRTNEEAAVLGFGLLLVTHIRDHAEQVKAEGGAPIDPHRIGVEEHGLPHDVVDRVVRGWQTACEETGRPAFLERTPEGLWNISPAFYEARESILHQGARAIGGRKRRLRGKGRKGK